MTAGLFPLAFRLVINFPPQFRHRSFQLLLHPLHVLCRSFVRGDLTRGGEKLPGDTTLPCPTPDEISSWRRVFLRIP